MAKAKHKDKPAKGSKKQPKPAKTAPLSADDVPEIAGSEAAYERLLSAAEGVDARDVAQLRADVAIACHNARKGMAAVLEHRAKIAEHLPRVDVAAVESIADVTEALAFAALRVDHTVTPETGVRATISRARQLRRSLLAAARAAVAAEILDAKAVRKIEEGMGPIDVADDCIALAALFVKHGKKLAGKTAVSPAQVKEAAEVGTTLRAALKPRKAVKDKKASPEMARAADIRNRFWTLLQQCHDLTWRIGAYLWGKSVDDHVPPLQRHAATRAPAPSEATAPEK